MTADFESKSSEIAPIVTSFFIISGRNFEPQEYTDALGISPTEVWKQQRKELIQREDIPNACWKCGFRDRELYSIDDAVKEVLNLIWDKRHPVKAYVAKRGHCSSVSVSVKIYEDRPVYDFSSETIKRLAELNCSVDVDIHDYS